MRVNVLYFAVFRERLGIESEQVDLAENATVADAVAALESRHPSIRALHGRFRVALNQTMLTNSALLADGDEIALIPPVAGGGDLAYVRVLDEPLSLDRVIAEVSSPEAGAIATFIGSVRNHSRGKTIQRLEYEAYTEMAIKEIRRILDEVMDEMMDVQAAVEHRVGALTVGDLAVVIACASPHRENAFAGCRTIIERLKERAPIWKHEYSDDGAEWVGLGP